MNREHFIVESRATGEFYGLIRLMAAVGGIIGIHFFKDGTNRSISVVFFAVGCVCIVVGLIFLNPNVLHSLTEHVGLTLIGLVVASVHVIAKLRR